jgi:histidinol-phosphate aminotransferase
VRKLGAAGIRYEQWALKLDYSGKNIQRMNLNENLVMPFNRLRSVIAKCSDELDPRFYSSRAGEGELLSLANEIAKYCKCSADSVGIGLGADQILDLVFKMKFVRKSGVLLTVDPSYAMYSVLAKRLGITVASIKLATSTAVEPFALNEERILKAASKRSAKMLVLASPNNPTGIQYSQDRVRSIVEALPEITIAIDEAYVEYADYTIANLLSRYKNLIIVRTFSKAFCLANLRLGYFLSSDTSFVRQFYDEFQYPYPVAGFAVLMAMELLRRKALVLEYVEKTKIYRCELISSLQALGLEVVPKSNANFVLVRSKESKKIAEDLLSRFAIAVKYLPKLGNEVDFLRITVGTREMNQRLLYSLRRIIK